MEEGQNALLFRVAGQMRGVPPLEHLGAEMIWDKEGHLDSCWVMENRTETV